MDTHEKDLSNYMRMCNAHRPEIFNTAMHFTNNNYHVSEEITQDVLLKLYIHFDEYDEEYLKAWLITTARNAAINYMMKTNREIPDENIEWTSDLHRMDKSAEEIFMDRMETEKVVGYGRSILDELYQVNERWYDAIIMVDCMGRKPQDVADEFGISAEVLYSVLYRARKWIRKHYDPYDETE